MQSFAVQGQAGAVAWSPDGKRLATMAGTQNAVFQVWDARTGKQIALYMGELTFPCCLAWSPDGTRILSGGKPADGTDPTNLRILDASTGQLLAHFGNRDVGQGHVYLQGAAWSPDGARIATVVSLYAGPTTIYPDEAIQIWNAATDTLLSTILVAASVPAQAFNPIVWSPDSKAIALDVGTNAVQIWDVATGKLRLTYPGQSAPALTIAWSPSGKAIASASGDLEVQVWDAATGKLLFGYQGHAAGVDALAWSPDGKRVVSGSLSPSGVVEDHPVQIWDAFTGQHPSYYTGQSNVAALAWSPDGSQIASAGGSSVKIWEPPGWT
jgi:WD40 repeat protein